MVTNDIFQFNTLVLEFERQGIVTRTFRRLDPERQYAIITAILAEAKEKGPTAINIKNIAERANVSVGSLYQYFGNRQGLLAFTTALVVRSMVDIFDQARPYLSDMSLREALDVYIKGGVEWSQTQAGALSFFARAAYHGDAELQEAVVRPVASAMRQVVEDVLHQAVARGEIRPDIDLEATARLLHALTIVIGDAQLISYLNSYFQLFDENMPPTRIFEAFMRLILRGIGVKKKN